MSEIPIQKIGRYEIEREIGRGGMAVVYKARDTRLDRPVAIKLIQKDAFATNAFGHVRERFKREAKALARLDHPNIVKVYDYGEYESAPYLVMDYLDGATLKELKKPVRVDTAVRLLTPIADALEYVHRHGLLHRDIKPSNIMMTSENRIVLTDFGIVKWLEDDDELHTLTATGVGIGTPEYMSPEQGRGKQVDARSDMYSLSIVFYELITGRKPFTGDTPVDILLRQISEPIPDPRHLVPEISPSVKKFLDRAAAKDPEERYPTAKEYLLDFQGLLLQAQANRAMGQTSNSGFQSLPRKTETTASSLEIGKTDLAKVCAEAATDPRGVQPQTALVSTAPAKRIPWGALTFGLVLIAVLIGGIFGLQNRGKNSVAETREAMELAMMAVTAESAKMTADVSRKTATEAEARANATGTAEREAQVATGTAERSQQIMTGTAERAAQIVTETVGAERTAAQATFDLHVIETAQVITYEAIVAKTQTAQTQAVISMTQTQSESARLTQASIDGTATAAAKATQIAAQAQAATEAAKYQVGNIIKFGRYEQDNDFSNGAEAIEWRILAIEGNTALVVSVMGLDAKPYHEPGGHITWVACTLRAWLNNEFYTTAFNEEERAKIKRTHVLNEDNPSYSTKGGIDTEDNVFLLSIAEAERYFRIIEDRKLKPTKYAIANGAWTSSSNGNGWWWLRLPGDNTSKAAIVESYGWVYYDGANTLNQLGLVRPVLRINMEGADF